jgi:hypothetical protein
MSKRIPSYGGHGAATRAPTLPPLPSLQAPLPVLSDQTGGVTSMINKPRLMSSS